jgi:hypothetical protein
VKYRGKIPLNNEGQERETGSDPGRVPKRVNMVNALGILLQK